MKSLIVDTDDLPWRASPSRGVRWKKLRYDPDRGESAVLLEFAPGATYAGHRHPEGESYFVLEGSLRDGAETYGAGTFVYHPPGSVHRPHSAAGCRLLVLLGGPIQPLEDDA